MFGMNDPFENINSMMNNFMQDPFGQGNNNQNRNNRNQVSMRNDPFDPFANFHNQHSLMSQNRQNPFALMDQMMGRSMGGMGNFNQMMSQMSSDPNSAVYSSSSVMTYSNTGDGQPKIYQASSQVRQGPGGVKETRQMLRDSTKGVEKVAVGHHIGDRAHVIERKKMNGGDIEEIVNLENLDDSEIPQFNQEFETKIRTSHNGHHHRGHIGGNHPFAIEGDKKREKKSKSKSKH